MRINVKAYLLRRIFINGIPGFWDAGSSGIGSWWTLAFFQEVIAHTSTQTNPNRPGRIKAHLQPYCPAMSMVSGGATTAPIAEPPMAIPLAKALSFLPNHSYTVLAAPGKQPPSPRSEEHTSELQSR